MTRYHYYRITLYFVSLTLSIGCTPDKLTESDYFDSSLDSRASNADEDTGPGWRPQNDVDAFSATDTTEMDSNTNADSLVLSDIQQQRRS